MNVRKLLNPVGLLLLGLLFILADNAFPQGKAPPPVKPNPAAPVLNNVGVLGGQRDTMAEVVLGGTNLGDATALLVGKYRFPVDNKDNTKLKTTIALPADAPLGIYGMRLATAKGMSNLRLFAIDELPRILKVSSAKTKSTPQTIKPPCAIVGTLDAENSDWYLVQTKPGQRLSFDVLGRRLGGTIDPQLSIYQVKNGREVAHENDAPGCQSDPRLTHVFKEGGDYLIEIKDVLNRGGPDYGYHLRVGDFPCATNALPMAIKRGGKAKINFSGPNVEGVAPVEVTAPNDSAITTLWVAPKGANGLHGWPVALAVSDQEEMLELEPNGEPAKANRVPVPGGITGRLMPSDDRDCYAFTGKKGQKLVIEAQTLDLYSPSLVYLVVKNAKGADIAKSNQTAAHPADQRIEFTPTEDGDYVVQVEHVNFVGGPSEAYRLTINPSDPGIEVVAGLDRWDVAAGSMINIPLTVNRRDKGNTVPIEIQVFGPPGVSGKGTIAGGQNNGNVAIDVSNSVPLGGHVVTLQFNAKGTQLVDVRPHVVASLNGLPFPPRDLNTQLALTVRKAPPFELAVAPGTVKLPLGGKASFKVNAVRRGYDGPIALEVKNLPANVKAGKAAIDKGQSSVDIELTATEKAPLGQKADVQVIGTGSGLQAATPAFVVSVEKK